MQYAGQSNMKKVSLETGGKSPMIYFADLPDMELAVSTAYDSSMQIWAKSVMQDLESMLKEQFMLILLINSLQKAKAHIPGDPLDPETNMGPLMSAQAQKEYWASLNQEKMKVRNSNLVETFQLDLSLDVLLNQPCLQM